MTPLNLSALFRPMAAQLRLAAGVSVLAGVLVLAPSVYMLQVYDRVINSRRHTTLALLTLAVVLVPMLCWYYWPGCPASCCARSGSRLTKSWPRACMTCRLRPV